MGWLVIDIMAAYLFKSMVRVFDFIRSCKWQRSRASFTEWEVVRPEWGCPSVKLHYEFVSKESSFTGSDEIPFYMAWLAKTYAESLSRELRALIRVNPKNPLQTHFFEMDQELFRIGTYLRRHCEPENSRRYPATMRRAER
jgi:hypothetical protein